VSAMLFHERLRQRIDVTITKLKKYRSVNSK
jgi:hypothetical protein